MRCEQCAIGVAGIKLFDQTAGMTASRFVTIRRKKAGFSAGPNCFPLIGKQELIVMAMVYLNFHARM
jgi:hypothetical protein